MGIGLCVTKAMINRTPYHRPIGSISLARILRLFVCMSEQFLQRCRKERGPVNVPNKTLYSVPSSDRQRGLKSISVVMDSPRLESQPDWDLNCSGIRSVGPLKQGAKGEFVEGALEHERWSQGRRRDERLSDRSRRPRNMQQQGWGGKPQLFNLKVQQSPRHQQGRTPDGHT
ncbi:uncharacterized protein BO96DRAFT_343308 [Aspergillus niger CBS 101883]|uniref:Uncharacterized protein n=2 Tax=Aspergillus niger TaxID=5061 RepID=A2R5A7_ASPNC|nr:uncharacterized protein BO96DRAFT_343308 [Aspergillus niger CBS 101883]XP_059602508.1 hypothetical protein An15g03270 [Aspergillus niger]PYH54156.1 hypothetical protein BO96DRAFT_343308 [Aspergillus niger CBS 101883]CAK42402.1 hypothetical protein An15g03270 [Aspergillus niger]